MVLGEIESALSLFDRLKRYFPSGRVTAPRNEMVASRFVLLFESHGVHRNQIPRFFGHNLTLAHVKDDDSLTGALTDEMLDAAADVFAVRREWLDGASDQIYPLHDFYKNATEFAEFLDALLQWDSARVTGAVLVGKSDRHEIDALVILEELIGWVGEQAIYRYHICENWIFNYWKARAYLAACVASAWKRGVCVMGRRVNVSVIRRYREGKVFLEYGYDGALPMSGKPWYPEDMALNPSSFLEGLDEGRFGHEQGLRLWLHLASDGLMETGLPVENVRPAFEAALGKATAVGGKQHHL